jgi:hypothetical protein
MQQTTGYDDHCSKLQTAVAPVSQFWGFEQRHLKVKLTILI